MPPDARVTITTVLYMSERVLRPYVESVGPALESGLAKLVFVDNASPDSSAALATALLPSAVVIRNATNRGFSKACNQAWPLVKTDYWLLLNPDVRFELAGLERLICWMDNHHEVGIASPQLKDARGVPVPTVRAPDTLWRPALELTRLHKLVPEPYRSTWLLPGAVDAPSLPKGWVPGAVMIVRAEMARQIGLLNEALFMYGEDREWCDRALRRGWRVGLCHTAHATHLHGASAERAWGADARSHREVAGHLYAVEQMHGRCFMRVYAALVGLLLWTQWRPCQSHPSGHPPSSVRAAAYVTAAISARRNPKVRR